MFLYRSSHVAVIEMLVEGPHNILEFWQIFRFKPFSFCTLQVFLYHSSPTAIVEMLRGGARYGGRPWLPSDKIRPVRDLISTRSDLLIYDLECVLTTVHQAASVPDPI